MVLLHCDNASDKKIGKWDKTFLKQTPARCDV